MKVLYINASVNYDSRTNRLAQYLLKKIGGEIKEIDLGESNIRPLNKETLEYRQRLSDEKDFDNGIFLYAKEYANADIIVIAAPYWDLSFPSSLKNYIEAVNVPNIVFHYDENRKPVGMCNAKHLVYITTSGGEIVSDKFGYGYIKELAEYLHGIKNIHYIGAENLDLHETDVEKELANAEKEADKIIEEIKNE